MVNCAYCGKETNSAEEQFICSSCSSEYKPENTRGIDHSQVAQPGKKLTETEPASLPTRSEDKLEDDQEANLNNWQGQELHPDFTALNTAKTGLLLSLVLAFVCMIPMFSDQIGGMACIGGTLFLTTIYLVLQHKLNAATNWCRQASRVYESDNWSDLYVYFKTEAQKKNRLQVMVYDEDKMFPDFPSQSSYSIKFGEPETFGYEPSREEELIPVRARIYQNSGFSVVIFESGDRRLWCTL